MRISKASIPEKIIYVNYGKQNAYVGNKFTSDGTYYIEQEKCDVYEYTSEQSKNTLVNRLNMGYYKPTSVEVIDNTPINQLTIDFNSGQVLRCSVFNKYNVNLNYYELLDSIKNNQVKSNGKITGEFVWAKINSELRLISTKSEAYQGVQKTIERRTSKKLHKSALVPGTIYETAAGKKYLFIDFVDTNQLVYKSRTDKDFIKKVKRNQVFSVELGYSVNENLVNKLKKLEFKELRYRFKILQNHSFVLPVKQVNLDKNIISNFRNYHRDEMKREFVELSKGANHYQGYTYSTLVWNSQYFNISKHKEKISEFEYKKYLAFT